MVVGCRLLVVGCVWLDICWLVLVVPLLSMVWCMFLLFVEARCCPFYCVFVCCLVFIVCCLLFVICCLLFNVCCSVLFVGCCVVIVVF